MVIKKWLHQVATLEGKVPKKLQFLKQLAQKEVNPHWLTFKIYPN